MKTFVIRLKDNPNVYWNYIKKVWGTIPNLSIIDKKDIKNIGKFGITIPSDEYIIIEFPLKMKDFNQDAINDANNYIKLHPELNK